MRSNLSFLKNILSHDDFIKGNIHTRWVDANLASLVIDWQGPDLFVDGSATTTHQQGFAGAKMDSTDPLALFDQMPQDSPASTTSSASIDIPDGLMPLTSPIQGTIVAIEVGSGESVRAGEPVVIVEAMKMEHVISADFDGVIVEIIMQPGDVVKEGFPILFMQEGAVSYTHLRAHET